MLAFQLQLASRSEEASPTSATFAADGSIPSCERPSGVRSSTEARPLKSISKLSGAKSGGVSPDKKEGACRCV